MSEENVELVYRAHDAFNRRDIDTFVALTDPGVELVPLNVEMPGITSYRGHGGVRNWWQDLLEVSPVLSTEIDEVRDLGDVTVVRMRFRGHGMEIDAPMEQTAWQVAKWRHEKALWWRTCPTEAEALEAAGLRE
jgi:ketosteroid isomerase-like protein